MSDTIWIVLGVLAFVGLFLWKKRKKNAPTKAPAPWVVSQGTGKLTLQGAGWVLDVPPAPEYVAYVSWLDEPKLREGQSLHIHYRVEGGPLVATEYPASPADCGVMIQRRGDTLSARGKYAGYRWFNRQHMPLTPGEHSFVLPLVEAQWGPVMGDPQAASFAECLANADSINIVFGGAGGRGHGVSGPARVELVSLVVP